MADAEPAKPGTLRERLVFMVVSVAVGVVLSFVFAPYYPPFGRAAGLFGGSVLAFLVLAVVFWGR